MKRSLTFVAPVMPIVGAARAAERARFLQRVDGVAERVAPVLGAEHDLDAVGGPSAT